MSKKKLVSCLVNLDLFISGICFVLLVVLTFAGVLFRYFLNSPIIWLEEIQLFLFLWIVFFAGSAAFREGNHIAIEMVAEMLPLKLQKSLEILIYLLTMVILFFLMRNGWALVQLFVKTEKATSVLQISNAYISIAIPVGCALMMINSTVFIVKKYVLKAVDESGEGAEE